jgi:hypothetical protein
VEFSPEFVEAATEVDGRPYRLVGYRTQVASTTYFDGFDLVRAGP